MSSHKLELYNNSITISKTRDLWLIKSCRWITSIATVFLCIRFKQLDYEQQEIKLNNAPGCSNQATTRKINRKRLILKQICLSFFVYALIRRAGMMILRYKYEVSATRFDQIHAALQIINSTGYLDVPEKKGYLGYSGEFLASVDLFQFEEKLRVAKNNAWYNLKQFGCYMERDSFFGLTEIIANFFGTLMSFLATFVYFNYYHKFDDISFIRWIFDSKMLLRKVRRLIDNELNHILNSSKNYLIMNAASLINPQQDDIKIATNGNLRDLKKNHQQLELMIQEWRTNDDLMPINLSTPLLLTSARVFIFSFLFYVFPMVRNDMLEIRRELEKRLEARKDPNNLGSDFVNFGVLVEYGVTCLMYYGIVIYTATYIATVFSQLRHCNSLLSKLITYNQHLAIKHEQILAKSGTCNNIQMVNHRSSNHCIIDNRQTFILNRILLSALLEYRIYVSQLSTTKPLCALVSSVNIITLIWYSVICRLFQPYWPPDWQGKQAIVEVGLIFCSSTLIPLCRLDSLGVQALRQLCYVQAECLNINERLERKKVQRIYFEHTIQLYHKELFDTKERVKYLSVKTVFCHLTYRNVVEVHFWFFMFVLATFYETESWRRFFGKRIEDPLGLFKTN